MVGLSGTMSSILTLTLNPALDVSACTAQVRHTSKLRCTSVERHPGGGGVNVARVLQRLGADVQALYTSGGTTGQLLTELLQQEGVRCISQTIPGHTRESFTVLDEASGQEYRFVLPGPDLNDALCTQLMDHVASLRPAWLVASGSLPPGVPPDFYAQAARLCGSWGARLVVDSSGPALAHALQAGVYLAKPSVREFRELVGRPLLRLPELADAAQQWVQGGHAQILAVSLGEKGALLCHADGSWYAPPLAVEVHSAVGAGDSFVAGMVHGLADGQGVLDAFALGVACGTAALTHQGTGLSAPDDVQRLLPKVRCLNPVPDEPL